MLEIGQGKAMGFAINTQLMVASKVTALGMTEIVSRADIPLPTTIHGKGKILNMIILITAHQIKQHTAKLLFNRCCRYAQLLHLLRCS